jgi:hypothetical protein
MSASDESRTSKRSVGSTALALGAIWTAGIVLMMGPKDWVGKVRTSCVDAAVPGIRLVRLADSRWLTRLRARLDSEWNRLGVNDDINQEAGGTSTTASVSLEQSANDEAARLWQARCEQLQVELAHAEQSRQQAEQRLSAADVQGAAYLVEAPAPLIADELIPANWIGAIGSANGDPHPVVAVGSREGIAADELVLDASAPHVDRGEQSGIETNALVLAGRRLVGRVREVGRWTSTIQPITDPEFRLSVQLLRGDGNQRLLGAKGVLAGQGDGTCTMTYVDATQPVVVGDLVVTPADDPHFPAMLLCGRVIEARLKEGSLEWFITVEPAAAIAELTSVAVLHQSFRAEPP